MEELERERERLEEMEIERQNEILEQRKETEEEKRKRIEKKRLEEEERRIAQFQEAVEKAKKEAELLRKAKLFKHVLKGAEETGEISEVEQKLLGVDVETGQRLLKEVSEFERQKRLEEQEIQKKITPRNGKDQQTSRTRSSSISMHSPAQKSPLSRNGFGRRSVRTTSRERAEVSPPVETTKIADQFVGQRTTTRDFDASTDEMIRPGSLYRPINRGVSNNMELEDEERRERESQHNKFFLRNTVASSQHHHKSSKKHTDDLTQSALFGPVPTRRRSMRMAAKPVEMHDSESRPRSFGEETSSDGSFSPDLNHNDSPLPSSTENVHPKVDVSPCAEPTKDMIGIRTRSALGSPANYLNGGGSLMGSRCASPAGNSRFLQKLEQKGAIRREEDCLSPSIRRIAEANLSRSPSITSLGGSFHNLTQLRGSMMNLSTSGEPSPNLSRFHSMTSPARQSLSNRIQKTSDRQAAVLDRLNRLRDSLHTGKNFTPPRGNRFNSQSSTPPMSPAKPFRNEVSRRILELLVMIHVYGLAAFLAIREFIFDVLNFTVNKKIEGDLKNSARFAGKCALVTGADGTIGFEIVRILVENRIEKIVAVVQTETGIFEKWKDCVQIIELDLFKPNEIPSAIKSLPSKIDYAIFTAGIMLAPEKHFEDSIEVHNCVNLLSQAFLYEKLAPKLRKSIFLTSATVRVACYLRDEQFLNVYAGPYQAYTSSKLYLSIYVQQLAEERNLKVVTVHPGTVPGKLYRNANFAVVWLNKTVLPWLMRKPRHSAILVLHTLIRNDNIIGGYYEDTEEINLKAWIPEEERLRIYSAIRRRLDDWVTRF
ncbi:unnamed protein product [Caenorhabditis bovis]|uniref:NAD-dependent epimerase/dehydratase domain-containing protein n=1 Tax=Caenorhabditis bovis TaxID=2654633 RepID=A0A8S1EWV5_9PELO|nr:unnamed protein product [Caenorhabditis bovis]